MKKTKEIKQLFRYNIGEEVYFFNYDDQKAYRGTIEMIHIDKWQNITYDIGVHQYGYTTPYKYVKEKYVCNNINSLIEVVGLDTLLECIYVGKEDTDK